MSLERGNKRKSHDEREEAIGAILSARDRTSARNYLLLVRCHPPLRCTLYTLYYLALLLDVLSTYDIEPV